MVNELAQSKHCALGTLPDIVSTQMQVHQDSWIQNFYNVSSTISSIQLQDAQHGSK